MSLNDRTLACMTERPLGDQGDALEWMAEHPVGDVPEVIVGAAQDLGVGGMSGLRQRLDEYVEKHNLGERVKDGLQVIGTVFQDRRAAFILKTAIGITGIAIGYVIYERTHKPEQPSQTPDKNIEP